METIRGSVTFVIWPRQETSDVSFRIVNFRSRSGLQITARGTIPSIDSNDTIELTGDWVEDPQYGRQFNVVYSERVLPNTAVGIVRFLAKEVEGVGPGRAQKIVDRFGADTLSILADSPDRLTEVSGISKGLAQKIGTSWKVVSNTSHKSTRIWLAGKGITSGAADRIIKKFGADTVSILTNNPYRSMEIDRIGFQLADDLAKKLGHPKESMERLDAACIHAMYKASVEEGHTCLWEDELVKRIRKTSGVEDVQEALDRVVEKGSLILEAAEGSFRDGNVVYLPSIHRAERILVRRLGELISASIPEAAGESRSRALAEAQEMVGRELTPNQLQGVWQGLTQRISGITGPPGVGKSESVKVLVRAAEILGLKHLLMAPTGRAAKRLSEATGRSASTIHRALEYNPATGDCNRNAIKPLEADLIVVDETSMLDVDLASRLFDAIPDGCSVVLIGDSDQLPSVGPGTVFRDLQASGTIHFTVLDTIFRQARGSDIIKNAHRIRKGQSPTFPPKGVPTDCYLMDTGEKPTASYIKEALRKLCLDSIPSKTGLNPTRDIQILIPMKIGDTGTREINAYLQTVLNPSPFIEGSVYKPGDRVMQCRNNYQMDVFNGDVGFVEGRDEESGGIAVEFDGRRVVYTGEDQQDLQLCYASTIHRSQGNQFPVVVVVVLTKHFVMLNRNLLYTAASRAQTLCVYLASRKALAIASRTDSTNSRVSLLAEKIRAEVSNAIA